MYLIMTLLASVLPAPDSPDHYKNHYKITKSINSQFVTWYNNTGVLSIPSHGFVRCISNGENVRRSLENFSSWKQTFINLKGI